MMSSPLPSGDGNGFFIKYPDRKGLEMILKEMTSRNTPIHT